MSAALAMLRLRLLVRAWLDSLVETSPAWLVRVLRLPSGLRVVLSENDAITLIGRGGEEIPPHRRPGRGDIRRGMMVPRAAEILRRTLALPEAALAEVESVVRLEMPVSTPFDLDEIVYAIEIGARADPGEGGAWPVSVAIWPRARLAEAGARIEAQLGTRPTRVSLGSGLSCSAEPDKAGERRAAARFDALLAGLAMALALIVWMLLQQQADARAELLRAALSERLAEAGQAASLAASADRLQAAMDRLAQEQAGRHAAEAAFAAVARGLPRATRLDGLSLSDAAVTLRLRPGSAPLAADAGAALAAALFPRGHTVTTDAQSGTWMAAAAGPPP